MRPVEQWIWLPKQAYPEYQTNCFSLEVPGSNEFKEYAVVALTGEYHFLKPIESVSLRFSGDTAFALYCNSKHIASGPATGGGDFCELYREEALPQYYATKLELTQEEQPEFAEGEISFYAQVRMAPVRMFDYSRGHGGFFLTAHIRFTDGTKKMVFTDESWKAQRLSAYVAPNRFDNSIAKELPVAAEKVFNIWHCEDSPIPSCVEWELKPQGSRLVIPAGEKVTAIMPFDMVYAGYLTATAVTQSRLDVKVYFREREEEGTLEELTFVKDGYYRGLGLQSAGCFYVEAQNSGNEEAEVSLALIVTHYPVGECAVTKTSDVELNQVLKVCMHTVKMCRQTIHLDSPRHCEPLACAGDYYVQTMMTAMTFGDLRLSSFDIRRIAEMLRYRDGRMFHSNYMMIWVEMLWDVYRFTGEKELLHDCEDALTVVLDKFATYLGDNGILETPPNFMFVDWLSPDGISLHRPPKALGQTCLNMFYYGALMTSQKIYETLEEPAMAAMRRRQAETLHDAILENLYDSERKLFFEGLNTPTPEKLVYFYMPQNVEKRYYRKHANILAAYFGFFDKETCRDLLSRIIEDDELGPVQIYFAHFLLEAVYRNGLCEEYTRRILEQWKEPVREFAKGLPEGFYLPDETYTFDYSHGWGGAPAYALPLALSGLEIVEPGYKKIRLHPTLLGLEYADVQIPTPFGMIELNLRAGKEPKVTLPEGVTLV